MLDEHRSPTIFSPTTITELIRIKQAHPQSLLWGGGTSLMPLYCYERDSNLREIIYTGMVQELHKISRREKYLEVGACVTVNGLRHGTGQNVLPPLLYQGITTMATEPLKNMITIGGALGISQNNPPLHIPTLLAALRGHIEIRQKNKSHWITAHRFLRDEGKSLLREGGIITRIRIPLEERNFNFYTTIGTPWESPEKSIIFCCTAQITEGSLMDLRFAINYPQWSVLRIQEIEKNLSLTELPIRRTGPIQQEFDSLIDGIRELSSYQKMVSKKLFTKLLFSLNHQQ